MKLKDGKDMNEYLIKKLKEGRLSKNLKQSDVAQLINVKGNTLSNYENGVSEPDIDTFCALCDIYDLDPAEILGEAYGLNVQGSDFDIKPSEIEKIKKYRTLDEHGKDMVDVVLDKEYDRCLNILSAAGYEEDEPDYLMPVAAHERTDLGHEISDEDRKADLEILRKMKEGK